MAYALPATTKTYRASQTIASSAKSCPGCAKRIRVGMPVIFAAPTTDTTAKAVAHHAACVAHRIEGA